MTISFAGHSLVVFSDTVKEIVKAEMRKIISGTDRITCYIGGYGDFDQICARASRELKNEFAGIEIVYVTAYMTSSAQEKIREMQAYGLCDSSLYPPLENVPPRFAISKRNEWMIENSDVVLAYVNHNYGGAYKSFCVAKRKQKKIINVFDLFAKRTT